MMGDGGAMLGWGVWWLLWLLVLIGVALLVYVAVRLSIRPRGYAPQSESTPPPAQPDRGVPARRILEERYARGEIDTEEFMERLRILEGR